MFRCKTKWESQNCMHQKPLWCNCSGIQSTQALISYLEPCPKGKSNVFWWPNIFPFWHHVWSCWIVIVSHKDTRSSTLSNIEYLWNCLATHCTTFDYIWLPTFSHLETSGKECFSLFSSGGLHHHLAGFFLNYSSILVPYSCHVTPNCSQSFTTSSLIIITFEGQSSHTL